MAEQSGQSADASQKRLTALIDRHRTAAEADLLLADAIRTAHAATVAALKRLDDIEAEIEGAVAAQNGLAVDTGVGARELQRFLVAKQREIISVVADASDQAAAKTVVVQRLLDAYRSPGA